MLGRFLILKLMKTAILGFGNPVRSDDAIGVEVVKSLEKYVTENDPELLCLTWEHRPLRCCSNSKGMIVS